MAIRTIMAAIGGGGSSEGAADAACRLGLRFKAHVEGFHVRADPRSMMIDYSSNVPLAPELFEEMEQVEARAAKAAKKAFDKALEIHNLPIQKSPPVCLERLAPIHASAEWRDETDNASERIPQYARSFDLVVVGQSERVKDRPHTDMIEALLMEAARPVFVAPVKPSPTLGETVMIAWNNSIEATRALSASLEFLRSANKIVILTVEPTEHIGVSDIVRYLAWHGIPAVARHVPLPYRIKVGRHILTTAREEGADLVVMGGYGHAPWREMLFGGTTRDVLHKSRLALLLAH